ncbi:hypothetical protein GCM10011384_44270 [Psychrobacillus lasiicapitis]|nr:hypothetical protein GCM10011384_44270 [Psychrobacillus lasiicapitis]
MDISFSPHGGPQAAERKFLRSPFQFFLNNGYSIFSPNFRGSTGYGLAFGKMVEGDWGYGPRLDNVSGLEWLINNRYAEKGNILLMGEAMVATWPYYFAVPMRIISKL